MMTCRTFPTIVFKIYLNALWEVLARFHSDSEWSSWLRAGANAIKLFLERNKLECFPWQAFLFVITTSWPYHLSFPVENTIAYLSVASVMSKTSCVTLSPVVNVIRHFSFHPCFLGEISSSVCLWQVFSHTHIWVALTKLCVIRGLKKLAKVKHSSLFVWSVSD
jgi:hypothetical protein